MVSPAQKKTAVAHVVTQRLCSVRRACRYLGLPRSTYRYVAHPPQRVPAIAASSFISALWRYRGPIHDMAIGGFVARWPRKAGRSAENRCNVPVGARG